MILRINTCFFDLAYQFLFPATVTCPYIQSFSTTQLSSLPFSLSISLSIFFLVFGGIFGRFFPFCFHTFSMLKNDISVCSPKTLHLVVSSLLVLHVPVPFCRSLGSLSILISAALFFISNINLSQISLCPCVELTPTAS